MTAGERRLTAPTPPAPGWGILTNYAQVLICIANDRDIRLRHIGDRIGITERAVHRIVADLADAGYVIRERNGRRNSYTINTHLPIPDPLARDQTIGKFLDLLGAGRS